jgi:NAD(P)-dependent dehydrogenase (short-subunit alcohol dehydrogenase family)
MNQLQERGAAVLDQVLDRSVVLGFSKIGYAVRRNLSTWPADPAPDALAGRDVVVTGASSGLGTAAAEGLARVGARVHLVVRDLEKGERARAELREAVPAASFELWRCDVSDLDDVRQLTKRLSGEVVSLGAVVHNAGAMPRERTESAQGHEMTMALHVLGPLVMTEGLLEPLAAGRGRVVIVTSGGMYGQRNTSRASTGRPRRTRAASACRWVCCPSSASAGATKAWTCTPLTRVGPTPPVSSSPFQAFGG